MSSLISMKNIGKEIAIKLESVNIDSPEKLIKLGAEKSFLMLKESQTISPNTIHFFLKS
ncbi:TfoX/Sxy family DNA transformation protein [uncultured Brachyspira sp.]|uniref:TfoX/Sxy family DNA transformation protein n=1 Tax=uncultured Brachyspira sp. TaxID=221953 RepID=UPI00261D7BB1|nr:TfoX/Sxy family DNA transformation protein [uncultured Brachyspira sp.]